MGTSLFSYQLPGGCDSEAEFCWDKGSGEQHWSGLSKTGRGVPPPPPPPRISGGVKSGLVVLILSPLYPPFLCHALPRDLGNSPGQTPLGIVHLNVCVYVYSECVNVCV